MAIIQNTNDLLGFLFAQSQATGAWFGYTQQKMTGIQLAHQIAARHADIMQPHEVVSYVKEINRLIYDEIIMGHQLA